MKKVKDLILQNSFVWAFLFAGLLYALWQLRFKLFTRVTMPNNYFRDERKKLYSELSKKYPAIFNFFSSEGELYLKKSSEINSVENEFYLGVFFHPNYYIYYGNYFLLRIQELFPYNFALVPYYVDSLDNKKIRLYSGVFYVRYGNSYLRFDLTKSNVSLFDNERVIVLTFASDFLVLEFPFKWLYNQAKEIFTCYSPYHNNSRILKSILGDNVTPEDWKIYDMNIKRFKQPKKKDEDKKD